MAHPLVFLSTAFLAFAAAYAHAQSAGEAETRKFVTCRTLVTWTVPTGTQVSYLGAGGKAYLWAPGNDTVLSGNWRVDPRATSRQSPLAYVAGSLGTLIGADLLNLGNVRGLGAPIASIGGAGAFDGIFLIDLRIEDKRVLVLEELGLPAVVIGGPGHHGRLPAVWSDDASAMAMVVEYLAALGHRRVALVAGPSGFLHTELRGQAFGEVAARLELDSAVTVATDYSPEQGAQATRRLLSGSPRPSAVIYDNDVMAVAGTSVAHEMAVAVPNDLSIVAWDDSVLCEIIHPPLTVLRRDIMAYGARAAERLLALLDGESVGDFEDAMPRLIARGSTARPPA